MIFDIDFNKAANSNKTIAVEFTDRTVRLLQLHYEGSVPKLRSFSEQTLPRDVVKDSVIINPAAVAKVITEELAVAGPLEFNTTFVSCLLPQHKTFYTTLQLPQMDKEDIQAAVGNKIGDVLPMPLEDIYWDWHRINTDKGMVIVQVAAIAKNIVDSYMTVFQLSGLVPLMFEPCAAAIAYFLGQGNKIISDDFILLELNRQFVQLTFLNKNNVIFTTELKMGNVMLSDPKEIATLERKIEDMVKFLRSSITAQDLPIMVYGTTDLVNKLLAVPDSKYNYNRLADQNEVLEDLERYAKGNIDDFGPLYGEALRGLPNYQETASINLVPQKAQDIFTHKETVINIKRYLTLFTMNIVLVSIAMLMVNLDLRSRQSNLQDRFEAAQLISQSVRAQEIVKNINNFNQTTAQFLEINSKMNDWDKFLDLISSSVPNGLTLTNIQVEDEVVSNSRVTIDDYDLRLTGVAQNRAEILELLRNLRASKLLTEVKLPVESLEEDNNIGFTIEAKIPFKNMLNEKYQ